MWPFKKKIKELTAYGRVTIDKKFILTHSEADCMNALRVNIDQLVKMLYEYLSDDIKNVRQKNKST